MTLESDFVGFVGLQIETFHSGEVDSAFLERVIFAGNPVIHISQAHKVYILTRGATIASESCLVTRRSLKCFHVVPPPETRGGSKSLSRMRIVVVCTKNVAYLLFYICIEPV